MTMPGVPAGGFKTVGQIDATNPRVAHIPKPLVWRLEASLSMGLLVLVALFFMLSKSSIPA